METASRVMAEFKSCKHSSNKYHWLYNFRLHDQNMLTWHTVDDLTGKTLNTFISKKTYQGRGEGKKKKRKKSSFTIQSKLFLFTELWEENYLITVVEKIGTRVLIFQDTETSGIIYFCSNWVWNTHCYHHWITKCRKN